MPATNLLPSIAIALIVTIAFMFALRPVALRVGLVDRPGGRKLHEGVIPITGGVAMFLGMFAGITLLDLPLGLLLPVILASFLVLITGVIDDRFGLGASARIATQVAVVLIMFYGADLKLADIGDPFGTGIIGMGAFTLIFTTLVTVTMINAYNFIDGADGLAGSLSIVAFLSIAIIAGTGNLFSAAALTVAAAAVGFLIFNFPTLWNRSIRSFMGDAGSTLLGFTIVWVTLGVAQGAERVISPVHCLWFAALPIFDLLTCFVRRALKGKSPFRPGRDHVHHTLLRGGFGVRQKLGILTGLQIAYAIIGMTGHFARIPDYIMFAAWAILGFSQYTIIFIIARAYRHRCWKRRRALLLRSA